MNGFLLYGDVIGVNAMDGMTERMLGEDAHFVLDNGATSFAPMSRYILAAIWLAHLHRARSGTTWRTCCSVA